jgi:phosphoglycerate dehydrogenase-like enzyme
MVSPKLTVTVPGQYLMGCLDAANRTEWDNQVNLVPWNMESTPPAAALTAELAIVPHYWLGKYDLSHLKELPNLRMVQLPSAGFEHVVPFLPDGVALANGKGVHSAETAELAMGLILAMQRGIYFARDMQTRHVWSSTEHTHRFPSLADRRVLVIGAGSVAKALVRRLAPFEVQIKVVGRTSRIDPELSELATFWNVSENPSHIDPHIHAISELPNLLPDAEIVVVVVPSDPTTKHLIGATELALMPDHALLINVARGPVVDTAALLPELESGRLRAGLDVTDPEPLPDNHPLWDAPNTLITPHMGGNTTAADARFAVLVQRQIGHLLAGEPLENLIEIPPRGFETGLRPSSTDGPNHA